MFGAGSRRRARSHARSCCSEDLPNLQISRQQNPRTTIHGQEPPNPDYRRLVFISSDSSSGREEDDADSSCSSSSYLNGLPRNSHAQSLEDCDWDYFESDTLPLPSALSDSLKFNNISAHIKDRGRAWDCCLGRGSGACLVSLMIICVIGKLKKISKLNNLFNKFFYRHAVVHQVETYFLCQCQYPCPCHIPSQCQHHCGTTEISQQQQRPQ